MNFGEKSNLILFDLNMSPSSRGKCVKISKKYSQWIASICYLTQQYTTSLVFWARMSWQFYFGINNAQMNRCNVTHWCFAAALLLVVVAAGWIFIEVATAIESLKWHIYRTVMVVCKILQRGGVRPGCTHARVGAHTQGFYQSRFVLHHCFLKLAKKPANRT